MYNDEGGGVKWYNVEFETSFEPTLNPFKNGLLVNYKKVGTRYMAQLVSLPLCSKENKKQIDLLITKNPRYLNGQPLVNSYNTLNFHYENGFCYSEFDGLISDSKSHHTYLDYSNSIEFLKYCEVENYNDLLFNNKKDIIFVVRNPIHRFFSGVIQVLMRTLNNIHQEPDLIKEINYFTGINDFEFENLNRIISLRQFNKKLLSGFTKELNQIKLLATFLIEKKWNFILQDIHTNNYLFHYMEWIYNIKDKSKIKIIDLKECRSNKSLEFFNNLIGNDLLETKHIKKNSSKTNWEWLSNEIESNEHIYELLEFDMNFLYQSSIANYLKDEYQIYNSFINSSYYVDLKD